MEARQPHLQASPEAPWASHGRLEVCGQQPGRKAKVGVGRSLGPTRTSDTSVAILSYSWWDWNRFQPHFGFGVVLEGQILEAGTWRETIAG
mmetsp:Transcript_10233/g.12730  ORF Transcript_10233/g.12730 Transcript_10233/m.12730 type:complete len:91 (-) Transcript_10233:152-424(-)